MITLYYSVRSRTSRQAIAWLNDYNINVSKKRIEQISRKDLKHILSLSENGIPDVLKSVRGTGTRIHTIRELIKHLNFEEAIDCLLEHLDILKVPIVFDEKRLVIGYNSESLRTFITKEYRKSERAQIQK
ncbi:ArsC/Spx/MgsR family protein [Lactococcus petauri]|uniref:ArsC/Spx/MgsR family protein n=1 Tax=Lactococcus petauri TaxID=1940789 RepID=UPI003854195C